MSKIVTCVRTLNEERNIAHFCQAYDWADMILVADGGSTDNTLTVAGLFHNVWTREFAEWVQLDSGLRHQPENRHINFLIEWAKEEEAEWIIFDDADCWPNPALRRDGRNILETAARPVVYAYRLYLWRDGQYFPKKSIGMGPEGRSVWAWRPDVLDIRGDESIYTHFHPINLPSPEERVGLAAPPYCLLHDEFPDEATMERKLLRNQGFGLPKVHPLESIYAPPEPLPEWVYA